MCSTYLYAYQSTNINYYLQIRMENNTSDSVSNKSTTTQRDGTCLRSIFQLDYMSLSLLGNYSF